MFIALISFNSSGSLFIVPVVLWLVTLGLAGVLFTSEREPIDRTKAYKRWASLLQYRKLIIPTMLVLTISVVLISVQAASLLASVVESIETSLGEYTIHVTLYLQLFVLFATVLLALISVSEGGNAILNARNRVRNVSHDWLEKGMIKHFSKEVAFVGRRIRCYWWGIRSVTLVMMDISAKWIMIGLSGALVLIVIPLMIIVGARKYRSVIN